MKINTVTARFLITVIAFDFLKSAVFGSTCNMTLVFIIPYKSQVYTDMHIIAPAIEIGIEKVRRTYLSRCSVEVLLPMDEDTQNSCDAIEANVGSIASNMYYERLHSTHPISAFFGLTCTFANLQLLSLLNGKYK